MEPDIRDSVVDFVASWSDKSEIDTSRIINWIGVQRGKFYSWRKRYGMVNDHNGRIPRDFWLDDWEREAIVAFFHEHPSEGYRRLTYMMQDADVVAVSPSSVLRVLRTAGLMRRWSPPPSQKGTGFKQPSEPHKHWHVDISYLNIQGTFYYLCSVLDGCSRFILHWEIRESMKEDEVEVVLLRAQEAYPEAKPRLISDNGPQFVANDFKAFIRESGMTHVRTSPYYPQSNGKLERFHGSLKRECIRPQTPLSLEDAQRVVGKYVEHYNTRRLHSAIDYVTPQDRLEGRHVQILAERDQKLEAARERRRTTYQKQSFQPSQKMAEKANG
ncbi:IS3 family transposase [Magnetofaba australis]|uniref:IS3 family transposase n=2 Tax=Magnetofaba australis TaxID=1472297 RepID=UPI0018E97B21|nr:IS3 family transposase [Magnetofaba australis]